VRALDAFVRRRQRLSLQGGCSSHAHPLACRFRHSQVWIDALSLEPVGQDVPVDRMPGRLTLPLTPSL
jgi:hypothetical protein